MKLMKVFRGISLMLIVLLVLAACSSKNTTNGDSSKNEGEESNEVITLNINNVATATSVVTTETLEPWKKLVEEKTNGKVKVNLYHSASLGSPLSVLQDVEGGLYEVGLLLPHYFYDSSIYPITITNLPFALSHVNIEDTVSIMKEFSEKYYADTWKNVLPITIYSADDSVVVSKVPIRSVDDLKKLKTRTQGSNDSYLAQTWGGSPVTIPLTEIYSSLQTGLIDLTLNTSVGDATDLNLDEVAKYATKFKFNRVPLVFIMNKGIFEDMPADLQKLFEEELNPALQELSEKSMKMSQDQGYKRLEEQFEEVIDISEEEYGKFSVAGEKVWDDWVKDANARGYDGDQMIADLKAMIKEKGYTIPYE
jgi:TRAP-type transport system periplasmic protein